MHIIGKEKWFIIVSGLGQVHYYHSILIFHYATSSQLHPLATKQRDVQRSVFEFPDLLYETIIRVLDPIAVYGICTDTTILVGAFFSLELSCKMYNHLSR